MSRGFLLLLVPLALQGQIKVPKTWDEAALAEWATPVAGLNIRPGHYSEAEYYRAPIDNLRTYPVYHPDREPAGYWEMLRSVGPKPLIEPGPLKTEADWIAAGKRVFEEYDVPAFRTDSAKMIQAARSKEELAKLKVPVLPDGTLDGLRWVVTAKGIHMSAMNCSGCHVRYLEGGGKIVGAPGNGEASELFNMLPIPAVSAIPLPGDSPVTSLWRSFSVPWRRDDIHAGLKTLSMEALGPIVGPAFQVGIFPRWHGSPYFPAKFPDLIGIRERKYIDHTATHQHRGPGDLMRYAALVTYSDVSDFGSHRILTDEQRKIPFRLPDEALYALALYIYSLEPPPNPNKMDERAAAGQKVFASAGCATCHTPGAYTNNKLTLAKGFTPPSDLPKTLDVMRVSVGTDPGLALKTRKGTGFYKVPSLKGLWYRGRYLHDGALTKLEEMFDPARLKDDYQPTGFVAEGKKTRAVVGHEFGLDLPAEKRADLVAFLKTL
ncbi:MAG TPA: hypothetical protein VGP79_16330 [Bryobacteraceae bacterium]|jgi:hypothetical protein|nr:hypothetical protein [Bryobacteraceae bacterium]